MLPPPSLGGPTANTAKLAMRVQVHKWAEKMHHPWMEVGALPVQIGAQEPAQRPKGGIFHGGLRGGQGNGCKRVDHVPSQRPSAQDTHLSRRCWVRASWKKGSSARWRRISSAIRRLKSICRVSLRGPVHARSSSRYSCSILLPRDISSDFSGLCTPSRYL